MSRAMLAQELFKILSGWQLSSRTVAMRRSGNQHLVAHGNPPKAERLMHFEVSFVHKSAHFGFRASLWDTASESRVVIKWNR